MLKQTQKRIIAKLITYRIPAVTVNWLISFYVTSSAAAATSLMFLGFTYTLVINYLNEWSWERISLGADSADSKLRSILKTVTYKVASTVATTVANYYFMGSWALAGGVALIKHAVGSIIFYINERCWAPINWERYEEIKEEK